jgi:transposase-like protein
MILQVLHCPNCQGTNVIRHCTTRQGKQRYRCQETLCKGGTFLLDYTYAGHSAEVKQQIVDMAMNARGIRDTARVLHVSPTTVIKELKKKGLSCNRCIIPCWQSCVPNRWRENSGGRMSWRCVVASVPSVMQCGPTSRGNRIRAGCGTLLITTRGKC